MCAAAISCEETIEMNYNYVLCGLVSILLLIYLLYALLKPERF